MPTLPLADLVRQLAALPPDQRAALAALLAPPPPAAPADDRLSWERGPAGAS